jgi:Tfp pilus assembly protein FimT
MLIVLAVVVALASMSWPSFRKLSHRNSLKDAARQLRIALARTRLEAIESGQLRFFRYQLGSGLFEIGSGSGGQGRVGSTSVPLEGALDSALIAAEDVQADHATERQLPDGVRFAGAGDSEAGLLSGETTADAGAGVWSRPVFFFPNGRATHAHMVLQCHNNYRIDVTVRGFTGTVKLGQVQGVTHSPDRSTELGG